MTNAMSCPMTPLRATAAEMTCRYGFVLPSKTSLMPTLNRPAQPGILDLKPCVSSLKIRSCRKRQTAWTRSTYCGRFVRRVLWQRSSQLLPPVVQPIGPGREILRTQYKSRWQPLSGLRTMQDYHPGRAHPQFAVLPLTASTRQRGLQTRGQFRPPRQRAIW